MSSLSLKWEEDEAFLPVTALQFYEQFILSGEGPNLAVYNVDTCERSCLLKVFVDTAIHGIKINELHQTTNSLCIFGAKCFRLVRFLADCHRLEIISPVVDLEDWIWDVVWLRVSDTSENSQRDSVNVVKQILHQDDSQHKPAISKATFEGASLAPCSQSAAELEGLGLACVLGHNSVCVLSLPTITCLHHVHCQEKCILYSASCVGQSWEELVVVSGTVFNQVVLWKPTGPQNSQGRAQVTHRLDTHEGVIFSTHYNPLKSMLASVSDDRSIRLWNISPKPGTTATGSSKGDLLLEYDLDALVFREQRVLYGHTARVWDVRLLTQYIVSIGEDSTCCVWNYDGEVVQKYKGHKGKSIWSLAVNADETLMVTGGGDASIRLWPVCTDNLLQTSPTHTNCLHIPQQQEADSEDFPRVVCQNCSMILVMTNNGVLWQYNTNDGLWKEVFCDQAFASYSVMSTTRTQGMFAVGNISGLLRVYVQDKLIEKHAGPGKIHSIVWLYSSDLSDSELPSHLLTTGPNGEMTVWELEAYFLSLRPVHTFTLPYTKQRWVTAALYLPQQRVLIAGDRGGTIHMFSTGIKEPVQSLWKIHGKTGVTDLCYRGDQVYSAGRDGQYRVFLLSEGELELLSVHKVYKGFEWIARLLVTENGILALGFHTDQFVAHSISTNQKLLSIPCGGGHRAWDFEFDPVSGVYHFVYIKNRDVMHCQGNLHLTQTVIKASLHGREVCAVKYLFSDSDGHVVATAGEDTTINLLHFSDSSEREIPEVLGRLQGHLSSVRALAVCSGHKDRSLTHHSYANHSSTQDANSGTQKAVLFSAGGRAEMKAWCVFSEQKMIVKFNGSKPSANGQCSKSGSHGDSEMKRDSVTNETKHSSGTNHSNCSSVSESQINSKSMSLKSRCRHKYLATHSLTQNTRCTHKSWKAKVPEDSDPETRYMDLSAFCASEVSESYPAHLYLILAACSDGLVRMLAFNEVSSEFTLLATGDFHNHCVLTVKHLIVEMPGDTTKTTHVLVLSAATDGKLAVWDVSDLVEAYVTHQCFTADGEYPIGGVLQSGSLSDQIDFGSVIDLQVPVTSETLHQSGINSLDVRLLSDCRFVVASGGDDNKVVVTTFDLIRSESLAIEINRKYEPKILHSAQITGIRWLTQDLFFTASIDQRLCLWKFREDTVTADSCKFTSVSDVSSLDIWQSRSPDYKVLLGGVGIQLLLLQ